MEPRNDVPSNDDDPPEDRRVAALRVELTGKRAALVSDKRNRALERKLSSTIGLKINWIDSKRSRKLQSAKRSVQAGSYDLVLIASVFMGHHVDATLKGACKQHGALLIDVKSGKFTSCLRALADALLTEVS